MKIVVLVIASHDTVYDQFATNWRSQDYPENVKVYFLYCSEEQDSLIEVRGDCIYLKGRECVKPGLHHKTLSGMQYILSEPFDYLIRTNLTSFINFRKLNAFLEDKSVKNCMAGTRVCGGFLSGSGYVMTRDIVQDYLTWCDEECTTNPMVHFDDEFVGEYIKEKTITCHDLGMVTYTPDIGLAEAAEKLHVRFKSSADQRDRISDIEQHRGIIEIYNRA
jgi:hypothetical protein